MDAQEPLLEDLSSGDTTKQTNALTRLLSLSANGKDISIYFNGIVQVRFLLHSCYEYVVTWCCIVVILCVDVLVVFFFCEVVLLLFILLWFILQSSQFNFWCFSLRIA
jgi:hypothetical protein